MTRLPSQTRSARRPLFQLACLGLIVAMAGCASKSGDSAHYAEAPMGYDYGADADAGYTAMPEDDIALEDLDEAPMSGTEQQAPAPESPAEVAAAEPAPAMDMAMEEAEAAPTRDRIASRKESRADKRQAARSERKNRGASKKKSSNIASSQPAPSAIAGGTAIAKPVAPPPAVAPNPADEFNTEGYDHIAENDFKAVADDPLSTFSIDVDTASYANARRFLNDGSLPPADAVRLEEMINYFDYDYRQPKGDVPFAVHTEVSDCPWNKDAKLVHVGVQGKDVSAHEVPPRNLVFLLDVSGSMNDSRKLPLLKQAFSMLVDQLRPQDRVSIVVYAGASGVVLEPTEGTDKMKILSALDRLSAGGSTNGGAGIELAYALAQQNFQKGAINRVILATDGDFNVGTSSQGELTRLIEDKRKSGVFLSVLGFGTGNVKDSTMEMLADKGNGNYAYIDSVSEARKVLVDEAGATLMTIAKDVKIQVEFNPSQVVAYRLVGYENRKLAHRDFNDDTKDAGEIGAGHTVTALYEVVTTDHAIGRSEVDALRYQDERSKTAASSSSELMFLKLRYKQPQGSKSRLVTFPVQDDDKGIASTSNAFRWSASVAQFGMLLRGSKHVAGITFADTRALAAGALGNDRHGYRREMLGLIDQAARLKGEKITKGPAIAK